MGGSSREEYVFEDQGDQGGEYVFEDGPETSIDTDKGLYNGARQVTDGDFKKEAQIQSLAKKYNRPVGEPGFIGGLTDFGRGLVRGTVSGLPEMAGKALQFADPDGGDETVSNIGKGIEQFGIDFLDRHPGLKQSAREIVDAHEDPLSIRGNAGQSGEMFAPSMGPALAGSATGAAIGSIVPGLGTVAGAGIGGAVGFIASLPMFGGAQAEDTYRKALKKGVPEPEAYKAALKTGSIEAVGEGVADLVSFKLFKLMPKKIKGNVIKAMVKGIRKPSALIGDLMKIIGTENITEIGQNVGEQQVEANIGISPKPDWNTVKSVVVPTTIMSLVTFGAGEFVGGMRRAELGRVLADPNADPKARAKAVQIVAKLASKEDKKLGEQWLQHAGPLLAAGRPIVADDFNPDAGNPPAGDSPPHQPEPPAAGVRSSDELNAQTTAQAQDDVYNQPRNVEYDRGVPFNPAPGAVNNDLPLTTSPGASAPQQQTQSPPVYANGIDYAPVGATGADAGTAGPSLSLEPRDAAGRRVERDNRIGKAQQQLSGVKMPEGTDDVRLKRLPYRQAMEDLTRDLTKGGGISLAPRPGAHPTSNTGDLIYDYGADNVIRTPSVNPRWFQDMAANPETSVTVEQAKEAVHKALNGDKLGVRQARVVSSILDHVTGERDQQADYVKGELRRARQMRRLARKGFAPLEAYDEKVLRQYAGDSLDEEAYQPNWDGVTRTLSELANEARKHDQDATEAALDSQADDAMVARKLAQIIEKGKGNEQEQPRSIEEDAGGPQGGIRTGVQAEGTGGTQKGQGGIREEAQQGEVAPVADEVNAARINKTIRQFTGDEPVKDITGVADKKAFVDMQQAAHDAEMAIHDNWLAEFPDKPKAKQQLDAWVKGAKEDLANAKRTLIAAQNSKDGRAPPIDFMSAMFGDQKVPGPTVKEAQKIVKDTQEYLAWNMEQQKGLDHNWEALWGKAKGTKSQVKPGASPAIQQELPKPAAKPAPQEHAAPEQAKPEAHAERPVAAETTAKNKGDDSGKAKEAGAEKTSKAQQPATQQPAAIQKQSSDTAVVPIQQTADMRQEQNKGKPSPAQEPATKSAHATTETRSAPGQAKQEKQSAIVQAEKPKATQGKRESSKADEGDKGTKLQEDVGENLWYNRRNFTGKGVKWADIEGLNDTLKIKEATKQKVWPRPNYEQLVNDGLQPFFARIVKQVYDGISTKPIVRGTPTDQDLQLYINTLNKIRDEVYSWAKDLQSNREFMHLVVAQFGGMMKKEKGPVVVSSILKDVQQGAKVASAILDKVWPSEAGKPSYASFRSGSEALKELRVIGGNKPLKAMQISPRDIMKFMDEITNDGWPAKQEAWQKTYRVSSKEQVAKISKGFRYIDDKKQDVYYIRAGARNIGDFDTNNEAQKALDAMPEWFLMSKRGSMAGQFDSKEEAIAEAKRRTQRKKSAGGDLRGMNISESERTGPERREKGKDVTSAHMMETFGFRGVNFGRKGWINAAERQRYLNYAYDALFDMAEILDVPPKALSLNSTLGIAFGAQGRGGTNAAHFVPGVNEINLTKTMGAGTLAHEWGHALDHYFAVQAGMAKTADPFLSNNPRNQGGDVRPIIVEAFKSIRETMDKRKETKEEYDQRLKNAKQNSDERLERWIEYAKDGLKEKATPAIMKEFDALAERMRKADYGEDYVKSGNKSFPAPVARIRQMYKEVTGRLWPVDNANGLASAASSVRYNLTRDTAEERHIPVSTTFLSESRKKDRTKKGKQYWSTPWEMFARSFETWVASKLAEQERINTFLSDAHLRAEAKENDAYLSPYPQEQDRDAINTAFDVLIDTIETKKTEHGTALFSMPEPALGGSKQASALFTKKRLDNLKSEYAYPNGRVVAAVVRIDPGDYLDVTAEDLYTKRLIHEETEPLNEEDLAEEVQTPYLTVVKDGKNYRIVAHEGRHRMLALSRAGVRSAPVIIKLEDAPYNNKTIGLSDNGKLLGQRSQGLDEILQGQNTKAFRNEPALSYKNPIDISYANMDKLRKEYGASETNPGKVQFSGKGTTNGMKAEAVEKAIAPYILSISSKIGIQVDVVQSITDLPERIRKQIPDGFTPNGVFDPDTGINYLVADWVQNPMVVVAHETMGHLAMEATVKNWPALVSRTRWLVRTGNKRAKSIWEEVERRWPDLQGDEDAQVREFYAVAAERRIKSGPIAKMLKQIRLAIRKFLKALGVKRYFQDAEIDKLLNDAGRYLQYGEQHKPKTRGSRVKYSQNDPRNAYQWVDKSDTTVGPFYQGDGFSLFPSKEYDASSDFTDTPMMLGHAAHVQEGAKAIGYDILDANDHLAGVLVADVLNGKITAIHDIDIYNQKKGLGSQVVKTILANAGGKVRIIQAVDGAKGFWNKMGVTDYDQYDNGQTSWQAYQRAQRQDTRGNQEGTARTGREDHAGNAGGSTQHQALSKPRFSAPSDEKPLFQGFDLPSETTFNMLTRNFADKFRRVKILQKAIQEAGGTVTEKTNVYQKEELFHGKVAAGIEDFESLMVKPLVEDIGKSGMSTDDLDLYLYAKHAPERNAYINEINPTFADAGIPGSGMSDAESAEILANFDKEGKIAKLQSLAEQVYAINQTRSAMLESAGLVPEDQIAAWKNHYQFYVPLKGNPKEQAKGRHTGRGFDIRGKESHRALGRVSRAESPLFHSIMQMEESIVRAEKNEVGKAMLDLAIQNPGGPWVVTSNPMYGQKPRFDEKTGEVVYGPDHMFKLADNVLSVKRDGREYYIQFDDEGHLLARAMKNLGVDNSNRVIRGMAALNRYFAAVNTSYNPEFVVSNFARDLQTAMINLVGEQDAKGILKEPKQMGRKVLKDLPKALRGAYHALREPTADGEWERWFNEYRDAGGKIGFFGLEDLETKQKHLVRLVREAKGDKRAKALRAMRGIGDFVSDLNSAVENGVRLATYKNAREAGLSKAKAASLARNLTVNFNRKGEFGTLANAMYLFYNAGLQGSIRMLYALKSPGVRKVVLGIAVASAAVAEMNRYVAGDDDDGENYYDKLLRSKPYLLKRNMVFMKPGGGYYTIPLPYGYNVPWVLGTYTNAVIHGKDKAKATVEVADAILEAFNPLGTDDSKSALNRMLKLVSPTIVDPWLELGLNEDYAGRKIKPEQLSFGAKKPESQLYWNSAKGTVLQELTEWLNKHTGGNKVEPGLIDISPEVLEHLIAVGTGGMGMAGLRTYELPEKILGGNLEERDVPFYRRFAGKINGPYQARFDYRENANKVRDAHQRITKARRMHIPYSEIRQMQSENKDLLRMYSAYKSAQKQLKAQYHRLDRYEDLKPSDPRKQHVEIRIEAIQKRFNKRYNVTVNKLRKPHLSGSRQ